MTNETPSTTTLPDPERVNLLRDLARQATDRGTGRDVLTILTDLSRLIDPGWQRRLTRLTQVWRALLDNPDSRMAAWHLTHPPGARICVRCHLDGQPVHAIRAAADGVDVCDWHLSERGPVRRRGDVDIVTRGGITRAEVRA